MSNEFMNCASCKLFKDGVCLDRPTGAREIDEATGKVGEQTTFTPVEPNDFCSNWEKDDNEKIDNKLKGIYFEIIKVLKNYCDIEEKYYSLIALWIIGTYFQKDFPTYPYLFFNAMRGSGKSRVLRLITTLSKDGSMLNSLTEAVLFRTSGALGIDEFEGISRKGNEALKELLNSAYKKGIKVKRMRKVKTKEGEQQQVEEFEVFRPIVMANIGGMEEVLGDRCIQIVLEKSNNSKITKKLEIFDNDTNIQKIKAFPFEKCRLCSVVTLVEVYMDWNEYIHYYNNNDTNNTNYITNTNVTNNTKELYKQIYDTNINGRDLELAFPLIIISSWLGKDILLEMLNTFKEIVEEKRKEDLVESIDVSLIDFVSQTLEGQWITIKDLCIKFKESIQNNEEWINDRWLGRALKRLSLTKEKKRMNYGRLVLLDVIHAQEKLKMFK
jgi:hypothetical protein